MTDKPSPSYAPAYVTLYPMLSAVARQHGYALAVHGSVSRDFDLIAVPWVNSAVPPDALISALLTATGGHIIPDVSGPNPSTRPHGRLAWSLCLGGAYLDISVMPLQSEDT